MSISKAKCTAWPWRFLLGAVAILLFMAGGAGAQIGGGEGEDRIFTLWPLIDYRSSPQVDYRSLRLLGPFFKHERKGSETEFGLRPLFFRAQDREDDLRYSEYLYPVASSRHEDGRRYRQVLRLYQSDFDRRDENHEDSFTLFPFLFYGEDREQGEYFAFFPLGGKMYGRFWRDEIRFTLFPLYGYTRRGDTEITNIVWPVYARIEGENEAGVKFWPLYGHSEKEGVYRKRFVLWPFYFNEHLGLDRDNPRHRRGVFPFYLAEDSPTRSQRTWLWPFFSHIVDHERDYEEWNLPWPLVRHAEGSYRESRKFLPFYSNERTGAMERRWVGWPIYLHSRLTTEELVRERSRVLFFLYSNLEERLLLEDDQEYVRLKRVALWPLFNYERRRGVSHFSTLALLEPFFPDSGGIRRNWSPLYSLYQSKWDTHGNHISSFLWNLYWKERRGEDLAYELFPLIRYEGEGGAMKEFKLLKGLVHVVRDENGGRFSLFYLPWGFSWGGQAQSP
ncbi:hypothetical protein [Geoalkalibacter halelectricus]|uniref:Uncharacterized protein n=1 Tax=Geoalkalibacter halelectricus TaxID=2847045 RepID=A0ABY5ZLA8_9BACT|nr:hypothetical protein [Geoalkalibacter halelectricus]MDO3379655.1 hypothetical protein [Geoalkalibacter halelectricus]UWZ78529.1 hypothetical protein L9S41_12675 [Geoalkalibacter halelectricus]